MSKPDKLFTVGFRLVTTRVLYIVIVKGPICAKPPVFLHLLTLSLCQKSWATISCGLLSPFVIIYMFHLLYFRVWLHSQGSPVGKWSPHHRRSPSFKAGSTYQEPNTLHTQGTRWILLLWHWQIRQLQTQVAFLYSYHFCHVSKIKKKRR